MKKKLFLRTCLDALDLFKNLEVCEHIFSQSKAGDYSTSLNLESQGWTETDIYYFNI